MQYHNDDDLVVISATDLNRLRGCPRSNALEIDAMMGRRKAPPKVPADVYARAGLRHETAALNEYIHIYGNSNVLVIEESGPFPEDKKSAASKTVAAIKDAVPVIHQGVIWWDIHPGTAFLGYADFLVRQRDGRYQVIDTKLAKEVKDKYFVQVGMYADLLERMTGVPATDPAIHLGTGEIATIALASAQEDAANAMEAFLDVLAPRRTSALELPRGFVVPECKYCRWRPDCQALWDDQGDLGLIAGVGRKYVKVYEEAGYGTIEALAQADPEQAPGEVSDKIWRHHVTQARLQAVARSTGRIPVEIINREPLERLPSPAAGDLYFDIEGYNIPPIQLEYLFGLWDGSEFVDLWAHSPSEEATMLTDFVAEVQARRRIHPHLHIYYYNHYETQALRRLSESHGIHQDVVEELCNEVMINLMPVVKNSLMAGLSGYGLKELEKLHGFSRTGEIKTAADSVDLYDQWLYDGQNHMLLSQIAHYNLEDLQSTQALHHWLSGL